MDRNQQLMEEIYKLPQNLIPKDSGNDGEEDAPVALTNIPEVCGFFFFFFVIVFVIVFDVLVVFVLFVLFVFFVLFLYDLFSPFVFLLSSPNF